MNRIEIIEPRWHDRVVLIAEYRLSEDNEIVIKHKDFGHPYYISRKTVMGCPPQVMPSKRGQPILMRQVPLMTLEKEEL